MSKQIEALKMAVELMERFLEHDGISSSDYIDVLEACKEALKEAEKQEPVAYIKEVGEHGIIDFAYIDEDVAYPVYTHPATWQSLSDDEIEDIWNRNWDVGYKACARAIEQALKEKNQI
jgi:hypothetical protein